jgi:hypothetical protein
MSLRTRNRGRTHRSEHGQSHGQELRILDSGEMSARRARAVTHRLALYRAPAKSQSASGQCDTRAFSRVGGAGSTVLAARYVWLQHLWGAPILVSGQPDLITVLRKRPSSTNVGLRRKKLAMRASCHELKQSLPRT